MDKRIDLLFDLKTKDIERLSKIISFFTVSHIENSLAYKDPVTHAPLEDLGKNYMNRFIDLLSDMETPLPYFIDDYEDLFNYVELHIKNILNNPHKKLVKESHMVHTSKLKMIDAKSFRWLGPKPGNSFKEKLANSPKVKASKKLYTLDVKENQVVYNFFEQYDVLAKNKIKIINDLPEIFGESRLESPSVIERMSRLNKTRRQLKTILENVTSKHHVTPNNALIGNRHYSAVWRGYRALRNLNEEHNIKLEDIESSGKRMIYHFILLTLMSTKEVAFVEKTGNLLRDDFLEYIVYVKKDTAIDLYFVTSSSDGIIIKIKHYNLENRKYHFKNDSEYNLKIDFKAVYHENRGIPFTLNYNNQFSSHYLDCNGLYELSKMVLNILGIDFNVKEKQNINKLDASYIAINDFSNNVYGTNESASLIVSQMVGEKRINGTFAIEPNELFFIDNNRMFFSNSYKNTSTYENYLKVLKERLNPLNNNYIIYDVKDIYDEFSSNKLRHLYHTMLPNSYPVWKSILAAESVKDKGWFNYVVDVTGDDFYIVKLECKKSRYIHVGPEEIDFYTDIVTEYDILIKYIELYSDKHDINVSLSAKNSIVRSGLLNKVFMEKPVEPLVFMSGSELSPDVITIGFDNDCYREIKKDIKEFINHVNAKLSNFNALFILPVFLNMPSEKYNTVNSDDLVKGAQVIQERLSTNQVCWYEKLPDLSLEVIKNGQYETLDLIKSNETSNIIGKRNRFTIKDTFTLSKEVSSFHLPLIKSFIGVDNIDVEAELKHPSFPLKEDIEFKLILEYSYGLPNSYELIFIPIKENPLFDKILANWKATSKTGEIIAPIIIDVDYDENQALREFNYLSKDATYDQPIIKIFKANKIKDIKNATNIINRFSNKVQRLYAFNKKLGEAIILKAEESGLTSRLENYIYNPDMFGFSSNIFDYNEIQFRTACEELYSIIGSKFKIALLNNKYVYPESNFGRIFAHTTDDPKVIDFAYQNLIITVNSGVNIGNPKLKEHLTRFTAATAVKHDVLIDLFEVNSNYVYYLLKTIMKVLNQIVYTVNEKNFPKTIFYMSNIIELIIGFLFLRDQYVFNNLRPDGPVSNEIIYYLKKYNKIYNTFSSKWNNSLSSKPRTLKSKYRMIYDGKPEQLYNVNNEIYCLILFLSGDDRANLITIESSG
ncbi:DUF2357 domain-containing protein [Liberiplasma polymorphum]|uniref:DUF2357 domain-containing protein n=1 Tax=Liberiplasma polymorphum TaxID=3374570 RepID=UPI0037719DEE